MRLYRIFLIAIVSFGGALFFLFWFDFGLLPFFENTENSTTQKKPSGEKLPRHDGRKNLRIVYWRQDLEVVDNRRIFMHKTSENFHMTARQSCSVESAARHNPDRPIQIYMRWPKSTDLQQLLDTSNFSSSLSTPWITVLRNYPNIEVILINETEYFNKTILADWFSLGKWRKSPQRNAHLTDYIRTVTFYKGGGLFLDLDAVVTIKPLVGPKLRNFFIRRSFQNSFADHNTVTTGEMIHLLHGHHLIDEIILNMAEYVYNPNASAHEPISAALDNSVTHICGGLNDYENKCLDVRLLNDHDVFLPTLDSPFWGPVLSPLKNTRSIKENIINKAIKAHDAVLLRWDWSTPLPQLYDRSSYEILFSIFLAQHCPFTIAKVHEFPTPPMKSF